MLLAPLLDFMQGRELKNEKVKMLSVAAVNAPMEWSENLGNVYNIVSCFYVLIE
jgi:hypothetical protein